MREDFRGPLQWCQGGRTCYDCRRPNGAARWRCKACRRNFSLTSGILFAFNKLPLQLSIAAILILVNRVKGKAALVLSRDLDVQYKTAFVLAHKVHEVMAVEVRNGAGRICATGWRVADPDPPLCSLQSLYTRRPTPEPYAGARWNFRPNDSGLIPEAV
ncbi:hypothetical protein [Azospirillum sp. BE72]|uniref:hypothetical protein n=1 Tax=Azospirillum sp. BE72 TaxID=2817776 RepID=UPI0028551828|nr:hypothetical protein [Azospirillum sp. BE72]MDR6773341.1 hypothetical protein [Azospirillum sp. BE72]